MEVNELRIGNMVNWTLDTFDGDRITPCTIQCLHMNVAESKESGSHAYDRLSGIKLTDNWCLRLGGIKEGSWHEFDLKNNIGYLIINPSNGGIVWIRHKRSKDVGINPFSIRYVHQLQNLYFSLTGKELTIKENVAQSI